MPRTPIAKVREWALYLPLSLDHLAQDVASSRLHVAVTTGVGILELACLSCHEVWWVSTSDNPVLGQVLCRANCNRPATTQQWFALAEAAAVRGADPRPRLRAQGPGPDTAPH